MTRSDAIGAHALDIFERWTRDVRDARETLGPDADVAAIVAHAAARWSREEPRELAFVPDEMRAILDESERDSTGADFLERIVRGEVVALRRRSDGTVVYLPPDELAAMPATERDAYDPYDPMLARALRQHALEGEVEALYE